MKGTLINHFCLFFFLLHVSRCSSLALFRSVGAQCIAERNQNGIYLLHAMVFVEAMRSPDSFARTHAVAAARVLM